MEPFPTNWNPELFLAHAAAETFAHDLNAYAAHCNTTKPERESHAWYHDACVRFVTYLGMMVGPFCGHGV